MHLLSGDANLSAESELATIGEPGRCIHHYDGAVDPRNEPARRVQIPGDDRFGMTRRPGADMGDRPVNVIDDARGQVEREVFTTPVLVRGLNHVGARGGKGVVTVQDNAVGLQRPDHARHELLRDRTMYEERLSGVAYARTRDLRVDDESLGDIQVSVGVHVDVDVPDAGLDNRHRRVLYHIVDQARAAPRDDQVDHAAGSEQVADARPIGPGDELNRVGRQAGFLRGDSEDVNQDLVRATGRTRSAK